MATKSQHSHRRSASAMLVSAILLTTSARAQDASAPAPTATNSPTQLPEVVISAFQRDYLERTVETAAGIEADPLEVPLTTVSIPMDVLTDQQVNNVEDALRNVAGVSKFKQGNGGEEKFSIRGFDASQSLYKDGARINNAFNASNIATTETANIERYDVLKGPAAILYGQGEPGGVINYITKKPLFTRYNSIEALVGSYDYYRGGLDLTGPFTDYLAYRMVTSYEDSGSHRDHTERARLLLAPSISWRPTDRTTITGQFEYISDEYTQDRGQVLEGDNTEGFSYSPRLDSKQFFGVPGWNDQTESDYYRAAVLAEHALTLNSSVSLNLSSTRVDKTLFDSSPRNGANGRVVAPNGDVNIRPLLQSGEGESDTIVARYKHDVETGSLLNQPIEHKFLVQGDFERIHNDAVSASGVNNVVFNVETREYTFPAAGLVLGPQSEFGTDTHQSGLVVQDLVSIGEQWHVLGGLRYTFFDDRLADVDSDNISPRTGLVYRPLKNLSFYSSWARGFVPTTATGFNPATGNGIGGSPLDPETTEQFEVGVKYSLFDEGLILNAAVFDLRKQDIVVTDPASATLPFNEQWSANLGETRTRGLELQAIGRITPQLRLIAGYAYLDNELLAVDPSLAAQKGNRLPGIPEHSGNVWGVYEFQEGFARGLGFGLGAFAQSDIYASTENRAEYEGWVQLDGMAYYKRDRWKAQINVRNLTDREYNLAQALTTADNFAAIRVGSSTPLTVIGSLSVEFCECQAQLSSPHGRAPAPQSIARFGSTIAGWA